MAIKPNERYPGQTEAPSADYPEGAARDVSATGAGDGTPLQAAWVNDLFGMVAAILAEAGIEASGEPETAENSQVLEALRSVLLPADENFEGLSDSSAARANLGLLSAAVRNVGTGEADIPDNNIMRDYADGDNGGYDEVDVELGGDFDAGEEVRLVRFGKQVTIMGINGSLSHEEGGSADSVSGVIPDQFRPIAGAVGSVYFATSLGVGYIRVNSFGTVFLSYPNYDGSFRQGSTTQITPTLTYLLDT